jgi:peptidyl-tRNA hydrolase
LKEVGSSIILAGIGKIAAQCSHASLGCYKSIKRKRTLTPYKQKVVKAWTEQGEPTIVLGLLLIIRYAHNLKALTHKMI